MLPESRPERATRGYGHLPPDWVAADATFFITLNCQVRGSSQLTCGDLPGKLFQSVAFYHEQHRWWPEMFLLMPDHLHALVFFSWEKGHGLHHVLADWKRYTARAFGIVWQRDFFDHRIRNDADHQDKWAYIRENPVRKGLVETFEHWPHVWFPDRIGWQGPTSGEGRQGPTSGRSGGGESAMPTKSLLPRTHP
jgi:REP element-mobilizing transposase RayT